MKAIINLKRYDTSTAELVASYQFSNSRDFRFIFEQLYLKKHGEWFLAGEGGPCTYYAESGGNNSIYGSERITPLTPEGALHQLEQWDKTEQIEKYFADKISD